VVRCYLPRHLPHHIEDPGASVTFLNGERNGEQR
jgi:hypothetical protein